MTPGDKRMKLDCQESEIPPWKRRLMITNQNQLRSPAPGSGAESLGAEAVLERVRALLPKLQAQAFSEKQLSRPKGDELPDEILELFDERSSDSHYVEMDVLVDNSLGELVGYGADDNGDMKPSGGNGIEILRSDEIMDEPESSEPTFLATSSALKQEKNNTTPVDYSVRPVSTDDIGDSHQM
mmetsp:Transcript_17220/g.35781  ORF Transcript_17220/g.35781 Transcript_17220/m.35781 type:complete len:183 (+) Transcript_17220:1624-2172(+)